MIQDVVYETKEKDFKIFCDEIKYWINKLNLLSFECFIKHDTISESSRAHCIFNIIDRTAIFTLGKIWFNVPTDHKEICKVAFHECMELLLGMLYMGINDLNVSEDRLNSRVHTVIRTLENTYFKLDYNDRFKNKKRK